MRIAPAAAACWCTSGPPVVRRSRGLLPIRCHCAQLLDDVVGRRVVAGSPGGAGAVIVVGDALERPLMLQDAGDGYCFAQLFRVDLVDGKRLGWGEQTY